VTATVTRLLLVDANVFIDYVKSELSILGVAARHLGEVYVLSTVLDEVDGLDEDGCARLGIRVFEPELAHLVAAAQKRGALSTEDHLCLILARDQGWTCVTNDGALRKACQQDKVPVLWGLELMLELVGLGRLPGADAIAVANAIHRTNPFHITDEIIARFIARVRALASAKR
jgi:rRNA-processing protein FCF1